MQCSEVYCLHLTKFSNKNYCNYWNSGKLFWKSPNVRPLTYGIPHFLKYEVRKLHFAVTDLCCFTEDTHDEELGNAGYRSEAERDSEVEDSEDQSDEESEEVEKPKSK